MLRIEERNGPPQVAEVVVAEDGYVPFKMSLSPYRNGSGGAPWYWRPHRGREQLFEVQILSHDGPLAAFNCISIREGLSISTVACPPLPLPRMAKSTVCVVSDREWFKQRDTADPNPVPTPSRFPVVLDEPIGVSLEVFADGMQATWLGDAEIDHSIGFAGGVSVLLDASTRLVGVDIRGVGPERIASFVKHFS